MQNIRWLENHRKVKDHLYGLAKSFYLKPKQTHYNSMYTPYRDGHIFTDPPGSHQKGQKRTVEVNHDPNNKGQAILFTYTFFFSFIMLFL
jgi:hypothetical protein